MAPQVMPAGSEVTVPLPVPVLFTVRRYAFRVKFAWTDAAALTFTTQVVAVPVQAPLQPLKVESLAAAAVRVTMLPPGNEAVQVEPHERPAGAEVTVPLPAPFLVTVSGYELRVKVPVTVVSAVTVTEHGAEPGQPGTLQPPKLETLSGAAVRVTTVPRRKRAVHAEPQVSPAGEEVMVPAPLPVRMMLNA